MHFFFDESGQFRPPEANNRHSASVVTAVVVPDDQMRALQDSFEAFETSRSPQETENGELKGSLLTDSSRMDFCDLLNRNPSVMVIPTTLEMSGLPSTFTHRFSAEMSQRLVEASAMMVHEKARNEVGLLSRQFKNLSPQQGLRLFALTNCLRVALYHAVLVYSGPAYSGSWEEVSFRVDRNQTGRGSREQKVASFILFSWLQAMSKKWPLDLIEGVHVPGHPFVDKYGMGNAIDLVKLIKNNLYWDDSRTNWGIRAADVAANIVYQAVQQLDDRQGRASLFARLMMSSPLDPRKGPGLTTMTSEGATDAVAMKYQILVAKRTQCGHKFEKWFD